jgi:hypothetical protein
MHKNLDGITRYITDKTRNAYFSVDIVVLWEGKYCLYRIESLFLPSENNEYSSENTIVKVKFVNIRKKDSYESCAARLDSIADNNEIGNYVTELEKIKGLTWFFIFPADGPKLRKYKSNDEEVYFKVLNTILRILDPAIITVDKLDSVEKSFVVRMKDQDVIIQDGVPAKKDVLSTGTVAGIEIAAMLTSMCVDDFGFYYCDEKFSYVNSDIERAIFATMIDKLKPDTQLFFTTHNYDILDMPLPKHSFNLMRKEVSEDEQIITMVNVGDYLKKNTDSVRNAVENDLFSSAPSVELLDELDNL